MNPFDLVSFLSPHHPVLLVGPLMSYSAPIYAISPDPSVCHRNPQRAIWSLVRNAGFKSTRVRMSAHTLLFPHLTNLFLIHLCYSTFLCLGHNSTPSCQLNWPVGHAQPQEKMVSLWSLCLTIKRFNHLFEGLQGNATVAFG